MAQTVELYFPNAQCVHFGWEAPPKCPGKIGVTESGAVNPVAYRLPDGSLVIWSDKVTDQYFADGRKKTWWAKPTLKDAVGAAPHGIGFLFHPGGCVEAFYPQGNYFWSATMMPWDLPEGSVPATETTTRDGHYYSVGDRKIYVNYVDCPYPCCGGDEETYYYSSDYSSDSDCCD